MTYPLRLLIHAVRSFWWPRLIIEDDWPGALVLNDNGFTVTVSEGDQTISVNARIVASFQDIESVLVQHFESGGGNRKREWWELKLSMTTRRAPIYLGRTRDETEASIAAAHVGTVTRRPVVALSQTGERMSGAAREA